MAAAVSRDPQAYIGVDNYQVVKFTHDIELATRLMRDAILDEFGCWTLHCTATSMAPCEHPQRIGRPVQVWLRTVHCLPNSYGAGEGWDWQHVHAKGRGRGAYPAVVFYD